MRVFDRLWYPLSVLLLAAIGARLIGPNGGFQVDKQKVCQVTGSVESPVYVFTILNISADDVKFAEQFLINLQCIKCHTSYLSHNSILI